MSHLTLEALARLVDEAPDPQEERHLEGCQRCAAELAALREQTTALATLPDMVPPPDAWPALRSRLAGEGIVPRRPARLTPALTRLAAALALFLAGGAAGYAVRGPAEPPPAPGPVAAADPAPPADPAGGALAADPAADPSMAVAAEMEAAEERFAAALDRYMMAHGTEAPDPATRLAALDNIVMTTAEALNESPADPVINSYHLTAVAQRNELLRQMAATAGEPVF